ncbi:MAG: hypothetical protein QOJ99_1712, partial [Bryobacterales bacterium]|nr:hypothetical protein [Bryobacterales bacterium]
MLTVMHHSGLPGATADTKNQPRRSTTPAFMRLSKRDYIWTSGAYFRHLSISNLKVASGEGGIRTADA